MTSPLEQFFGQDPGIDPLLAQMIALDNARWKVTLFLDGQEITGTLISAWEYMCVLDVQIAKYDTGMGSAAGYIRHGLGSADHAAMNTGSDPDAPGSPEWIHLTGAAIYRAQGRSQTIGLWRGRAAAVSGWTLRTPTDAED